MKSISSKYFVRFGLSGSIFAVSLFCSTCTRGYVKLYCFRWVACDRGIMSPDDEIRTEKTTITPPLPPEARFERSTPIWRRFGKACFMADLNAEGRLTLGFGLKRSCRVKICGPRWRVQKRRNTAECKHMFFYASSRVPSQVVVGVYDTPSSY